jgi:hypothetical protein
LRTLGVLQNIEQAVLTRLNYGAIALAAVLVVVLLSADYLLIRRGKPYPKPTDQQSEGHVSR